MSLVIQDTRSNSNVSEPCTWIRKGESWDDIDALPDQVLIYTWRGDDPASFELSCRVYGRDVELLKAMGDVANALETIGTELVIVYSTIEAEWPDVLEADDELLKTAEAWE